MYVEVHMVDNKWYRKDTGVYVGDNIHPGKLLDSLKNILGDRPFARNDKDVISIYHGYYNKDFFFYHFCSGGTTEKCLNCDVFTKALFCPKEHKGGYFIKV